MGRHGVCEVQKDAGLCTSVFPMCTESKPFPYFILSLLSPVSLLMVLQYYLLQGLIRLPLLLPSIIISLSHGFLGVPVSLESADASNCPNGHFLYIYLLLHSKLPPKIEA